MRSLLIALALAGAHLLAPDSTTWKPDYAAASPEVQAWYLSRELTPQTRLRLQVSWKSCCAHSDVVKTQFRVERGSGLDQWFWWDPDHGGWRRIPEDTIHWGEHTPDGQATLFAYRGVETCFFPADGGI